MTSANVISQETFCYLRHVSVELLLVLVSACTALFKLVVHLHFDFQRIHFGSRYRAAEKNVLQILAEIQKMMTETKCEPEQFPGWIFCMSMYDVQ